MMDYTKSNDCILRIHPGQNEHQWSVNDSCSCILDYLRGDRLRIAINEVLADVTGKQTVKSFLPHHEMSVNGASMILGHVSWMSSGPTG